MHSNTKHVKRRTDQASTDWERGMEYSKELGVGEKAELLRLCADKRENVSRRRTACLALGFFKYKAAVPVLMELANDDDLSIVLNATRALGMIRSKRSVRPMITLAKGPARLEVRNNAIGVLEMLGDSRAEETLLSILRNTAEEESTRWYAVDAIAGLQEPSEQAVASILSVLKDSSAILRWHILQALGTMGDQRAIPAIQASLTDVEVVPHLPSQETVARAAENALRNLTVCAKP